MSDPKYNKYAGTVRFDDDNIVDIDLEPDTENITVKLNGTEISGGGDAGLPEVDSSDNGDVLTVVEGVWAKAAPASQFVIVEGIYNSETSAVTLNKTFAEISSLIESKIPVFLWMHTEFYDELSDYDEDMITFGPLTRFISATEDVYTYSLLFYRNNSVFSFDTDSVNGYPTYQYV